MSVDVSDAAAASLPVGPRKAVTWVPTLVASAMQSTLAAMPADEAAALWPELWVQQEEIDAARQVVRVDRLAGLRASRASTEAEFVPRSRRRSREDQVADLLRVQGLSLETSSPPPPDQLSPTGLCLASGFGQSAALAASTGSGQGSALAASASASASLPPAPSAPPQAANNLLATHLCLQRAASLGAGPVGDNVAMRGLSTAPNAVDASSYGNNAPPHKRHARNPHGLTMSQRVAALQIGRPATYVHSTL